MQSLQIIRFYPAIYEFKRHTGDIYVDPAVGRHVNNWAFARWWPTKEFNNSARRGRGGAGGSRGAAPWAPVSLLSRWPAASAPPRTYLLCRMSTGRRRRSPFHAQ